MVRRKVTVASGLRFHRSMSYGGRVWQVVRAEKGLVWLWDGSRVARIAMTKSELRKRATRGVDPYSYPWFNFLYMVRARDAATARYVYPERCEYIPFVCRCGNVPCSLGPARSQTHGEIVAAFTSRPSVVRVRSQCGIPLVLYVDKGSASVYTKHADRVGLELERFGFVLTGLDVCGQHCRMRLDAGDVDSFCEYFTVFDRRRL